MSQPSPGENPNLQRNHFLIHMIMISAAVIGAVILILLLLYKNSRLYAQLTGYQERLEQEEGAPYKLYTQEEAALLKGHAQETGAMEEHIRIERFLKESIEQGASDTEILRGLLTSDIVIPKGDSNLLVPVLQGIPASDFKEGDFELENNRDLRSKKETEGIEISYGVGVNAASGYIDWEKIRMEKISGVSPEFALIRAAYRNVYNEPAHKDSFFDRNAAGAAEQGMELIAYYEMGDISPVEAEQDAAFMLRMLEESGLLFSKTVPLRILPGSEDKTEAVRHFCGILQEAGYTPLLAGDISSLYLGTDLNSILQEEAYSFWIMSHDTKMYFPYRSLFWEYTDTGELKGCPGYISLNVKINYLTE